MKFVAIVFAALAASASAFAPACNERVSTSLNMDRRAAFGAIAGAVAVVTAPQLASADGAVSAATINRAKFVYGEKISALKSAVEKGDFDAVAAEKKAFILFNSGAFPGAKNKAVKAKAIAGTNEIFAAVKAGDKAALKSAYNSYISTNNIKAFPDVSSSNGQGYSGDFDFKKNTRSGAIYVR